MVSRLFNEILTFVWYSMSLYIRASSRCVTGKDTLNLFEIERSMTLAKYLASLMQVVQPLFEVDRLATFTF